MLADARLSGLNSPPHATPPRVPPPHTHSAPALPLPQRLQAFSPQAIGNVAFAYSALKWRHHGLHTALPRAVQRALPRLTNKQVATTLRALVKIGINDPELMRDVAVRLGDRAVCAELTTQVCRGGRCRGVVLVDTFFWFNNADLQPPSVPTAVGG